MLMVGGSALGCSRVIRRLSVRIVGGLAIGDLDSGLRLRLCCCRSCFGLAVSLLFIDRNR